MGTKQMLRCGALLAGLCLVLTACGGQSPDMPAAGRTDAASSSTESAAAAGSQRSDHETSSTAGRSTADPVIGSAVSAGRPSRTTVRTQSRPAGAGSGKTTARRDAAQSAQSLLNSAGLKPMRTNCPKLDGKVDDIFGKILTSGMSTYEKVKACFDYLVKNGVYSSENTVGSPIEGIFYDSVLDTGIVNLAYSMLVSNKGVCDHYSAAFVVMTRAIGLESYLVSGQVSAKGGGTTSHTWVNVKIGGTYYVFDPQVQQDNPGSPYFYFCKTDAQMGKTYQYNDRDGFIGQFRQFACVQETAAAITVEAGGKTYTASLNQRESAADSQVFPGGISFGGDATVRVEVVPSGGKGRYQCRIGIPLWDPGRYADEVITGSKTFTFQAEQRTTDIEVVVQDIGEGQETNNVIFSFTMTYTG